MTPRSSPWQSQRRNQPAAGAPTRGCQPPIRTNLGARQRPRPGSPARSQAAAGEGVHRFRPCRIQVAAGVHQRQSQRRSQGAAGVHQRQSQRRSQGAAGVHQRQSHHRIQAAGVGVGARHPRCPTPLANPSLRWGWWDQIPGAGAERVRPPERSHASRSPPGAGGLRILPRCGPWPPWWLGALEEALV